MAANHTTTKAHFTAFIQYHKSKILPLLGEGKIANLLKEDKCANANIYQYQRLNKQPPSIKAKLKAHQLDGVAFLCWLRENSAHGILADEMGLGKTLQILSFFQHIIDSEKNDDRPFLVVCPLSVLDSWLSEINKWTNLRAAQYHGDTEKRQKIGRTVKMGETNIVLVTYETVVLDIYRICRMANWRCVACDEGHRLKNSTKQLSVAIRKLRTDQRLILSGTPVQNDLNEIWSMISWLYPEVFVKETSEYFNEAFSLTEGRVDSAFLDHVRRFLEIIMIRRVKESTAADLQLTQKNEVILYVPLTESQKHLYLDVLTGDHDHADSRADHHNNDMLATPPPSPGTGNHLPHSPSQGLPKAVKERSITNMLMELRQICIHSLFIDSSENIDEDPDINLSNLVLGSSKFIVLKRLVEEEVIKNGKKILIFSGFNYALDCSESLLATMGIPCLRLDGNACYGMRRYNIHRFQNRSEYKVFIMATRAGGEGITLTAAEVVVFLDWDWNPQVTAQAEARAYRIGQTKPVTVYKICTRGTVEEQMLNRVNKKLYLASKITDNFTNTNSQTESIESDSVFIQNLIRDSQTAVKVAAFRASELLTMEWEDVLRLCKKGRGDEDELHSPSSSPAMPQSPIFHDDEKLWLAKNERVKTSLFDGKMFSRPKAKLESEVLTELDLYNRRLNKSRTVYDDSIDYYVSKESTLCNYGEAVPTLTNGSSSKVKKVENTSGIDFKHLKSCMVCGRSGQLEKCLYCPRVYHEKCLNRQTSSTSKKYNAFNNTICPHHRCSKCGLGASKAGGVLFSCHACPNSFCIYCIDLSAIDSIDGELPEFEELNHNSPNHVQHITCATCLDNSKLQDLKRAMTPTESRVLRKRTRRYLVD